MLSSALTSHVFRCFSCNRGLLLKRIYLLRALRMFPVYAPNPPVCYIHVSEYMCLSFPVRTESKCNTGKQERDWLCLHYQARETRAFWIPCLVYPHFGAAGGNRSSIFHQIFTYITCTCSYCVFYTNRWLQKNFPFFQLFCQKNRFFDGNTQSRIYNKTRDFVLALKFWRLRKHDLSSNSILYHDT